MSRVLAIDTSGPVLGLALWENDSFVAGVENTAGMRHTENLLPHIDKLVSDAGWRSCIDVVAVARGPGSFTGLRIGMATAKAIAFAGDIPVVSVGTLDAIAQTERYHRIAAGTAFPEAVVPVLDARKQRFYTAVFTHSTSADGAVSLRRITEDFDISYSEIIARTEGFALAPFPVPILRCL